MPADHSLYLSREHVQSVLMSVGIVRIIHMFSPAACTIARQHRRAFSLGLG